MTRTHLVAIMTPMVKSLLGSVLTAAILVSCLWLTGGAEAAELDREYLPIAESRSVGVHVAARLSEPMTDPITRTGQPGVGLNRLGLLLQIIGFFVIAVMAGILLDRGFTDTWSDRTERWLSNAARDLDTVAARVARLPIICESRFLRTDGDGIASRTLSSLRSKTFGQVLADIPGLLFGAAIMCLPLMPLIVGALLGIRWLFWLGVGLVLFVPFVSSTGLVVVLTKEWDTAGPRPEGLSARLTAVLYSSVMYLGMIGFFLLYAVLSAVFIATVLCLRPFQTAMVLLGRSDMLRRILLVTGTLAVLSGLILQYVALR